MSAQVQILRTLPAMAKSTMDSIVAEAEKCNFHRNALLMTFISAMLEESVHRGTPRNEISERLEQIADDWIHAEGDEDDDELEEDSELGDDDEEDDWEEVGDEDDDDLDDDLDDDEDWEEDDDEEDVDLNGDDFD